ncbi:CinA family protein [Puia sp. P3]|uniref:CinA family protein n=1 Tax=Puia sp. P3 TaxID=3423952 RepID=UPI003D667D48
MSVYTLGDVETIKNLLLKLHETVAVAESVTSGHLQAALSLAEDARRVFQGGITVYNVGQKCRQLGVEPVHALECDGVSPLVAEEMARSVAERFCASFGIGITGYAAPVPEKNIEETYAFFCIYGRGKSLKLERLEGPDEDAITVQVFYVNSVLDAFREVLQGI